MAKPPKMIQIKYTGEIDIFHGSILMFLVTGHVQFYLSSNLFFLPKFQRIHACSTYMYENYELSLHVISPMY